MRKLKDEGIVKTYLSEESSGPPRKYYSLTQLGKEKYLNDLQDWEEFLKIVTKTLKGEKNE